MLAEAADAKETAILGHDLFSITGRKQAYGELRRSSSPADGWMTSNAPLPHLRGSLPGRKQLILPYTAYWTAKKSAARPSRVQRPPFCMIPLHGFMTASVTHGRIILIHLADSFMISADNAHAVHPNHTDKSDPSNRPYLNGGIVLKFNANQKYCTDAISAAMFRDICGTAGVTGTGHLPTARIWQAVLPLAASLTHRSRSIQWISACPSSPCTRHMRQQA